LNKLLLLLGVVMLFGISTLLPGSKSAQSLTRLDNVRPVQDADERGGEEEKASKPDRMRFRRLQLQDEKGFIPVDGIEKARQHTRQMRVAPQGTIKPDTWSWLGPGNIGGRIRSIVIHPTFTNTMWVGSVGGGIWRTDNGGNTWQPVNDFMANLAVSTMVINPADPSRMYAGTGELFAGSFPNPGGGFTPDGLLGAGVFNSTDSGLTWNQLPSTNPTVCPAPATPANCPWLYVNRLAISPNGSTILAATGTGIQRSLNAGATFNPTNVTGSWLDLDFHPTNNQQAIASANGAADFSLNGGQTWTVANFNPAISGRVELAYAPSNPAIVYASVNQNNGEVYRSADGGQTYTRVNTGTNFFLQPGPPPTSSGGYNNIIWVNPQDPTMVIVGGIDLWRSTNSGTTFTQISRWQDAPVSSAHADHHMIVAHPGFNNTTNLIVYFGNDGGIYRADNASTVAQTSGWTQLNNNLGITQFYGVAGNFITDVFGNSAPVIVGGTQDNGTLAYTSSPNWAIGEGGDGGYCAADPVDPVYYGEYIYLTIYRNFGGSLLFGDIYFGINDANNAATANFIAPFILDPNDSNTMLAGGLSLWRSNDVKSFVPPPTWTAVPKQNPNSSLISAIAVSANTSTIITVGHNNGDIFLTFNGTDLAPNWAKIDPPAPALPDRFVTRLTIDHTRSPSWIYATFGGFSGDNVYRTTNFGATWTDITGSGATGLPNVPVRSLVFHPRNPNLLYVGTEIGVFTSDDGGATWATPQNGPANVSVDELFWMGEDLIAATHGRGVYRASGGIYVDCNYKGIELGTFDQPFKTITAALNAATTYRTIWLKQCLYNEPPIINQRVEIRSLGGVSAIRKP
jgi:photosystem II stability/assembly factor-like uncharacterized protein